jgi:3D (Asp-Asp-Asp) domain-containing protein
MKLLFGGSAALAVTVLTASVLFNARPSLAETVTPHQSTQTTKTQKESTPKSVLPEALVASDNNNINAELPASVNPLMADSDNRSNGSNINSLNATASSNATSNPDATIKASPSIAMLAEATPPPPPPPALRARTVKPAPAFPTGASLTAPQSYTATAYNLYGRTASGRSVSKGIIAADPRVLPLGTRVRLEAGAYSGEYLVADTGGAVRGRHIDVWVPHSTEACRFGRRNIKLTVLSYGGRRRR